VVGLPAIPETERHVTHLKAIQPDGMLFDPNALVEIDGLAVVQAS
jgi:hypothetical protein